MDDYAAHFEQAVVDTSVPYETWQPKRSPSVKFKVAGLFAGVGGIEQGFRNAGHQTVLLAEQDDAAKKVLEKRFPDIRKHDDVRTLRGTSKADLLTAGFPCQDLSQVGRCAGIEGPDSSLVGHVFDLLAKRGSNVKWLVLENVPFMLRLDRGQAIAALVEKLEALGWAWAYRIVDARAFGLPQRRRRVVMVASRDGDPRQALLGQDSPPPNQKKRGQHACGFYWTEGNRGVGWAIDSIPPLKGGSGVSIPSPPAIWFPRRGLIATPTIEDAERMQGFDAGWTAPAADAQRGDRRRWRLVGNAVSTRMSEWVARRLSKDLRHYDDTNDTDLHGDMKWPDAAWGYDGERAASPVSDWPVERRQEHLASFLKQDPIPLSLRATSGFWGRLQKSGLRYDEAFGEDLATHVEGQKNRQ
ncbi:MAG: DNA (cytosine-5-)-methyltransferase [Pseudomonadota bacterium]